MKTRSDRRIFKLQADICRGLAHPLRLEVLHLLGPGEMAFGDLLQRLDVSKPKLSQHLAVLRHLRMVSARREGPRVFYRLTHPEVEAACDAVRQVLAQHLVEVQTETSALLRRVGGGQRR